jgi:hypothetical protein
MNDRLHRNATQVRVRPDISRAERLGRVCLIAFHLTHSSKHLHHAFYPQASAQCLGCVHERLWRRDAEPLLELAHVERFDESVERQDWVTIFGHLESLVKIVIADSAWVAHFSLLLWGPYFGNVAAGQVLDGRDILFRSADPEWEETGLRRWGGGDGRGRVDIVAHVTDETGLVS